MYDKPEMPRMMELPAEPRVEFKAEADAARRDLEERMRQATMNRRKSVMSTPELARSAGMNRQTMLSNRLG